MAKKPVIVKPFQDLLEGWDKNDPSTLAKVDARVREYAKLSFLEMNRVQENFIRIKNHRGRMPRTRLFEGGNQSGKSTIGVAEDIAHALGFRPWLLRSDPDHKIPIEVPNVGMVGCEVAGQTLAQNIEPKFNDLLQADWIADREKYSDGSVKSIKLVNGSVIHFRSYVQPPDSFEGVVFHWLHWDEPPPRAILNAAERGKMKHNAPSWLTMTPLKEPYIYDIFSLHAFNAGGEDPEIAIFRCGTWENCQDWCRDCDVMIPENDPEKLEPGQMRPVGRCPKCNKVLGFMPRAGIDNYLKKITDPDEREAREEGKWKHLSGLVYKKLDRNIHIVPDFEIPKDWMRIEAVDPADSRPTRWLFGAVSPEDITIDGRRANRIYWYTYLLAEGNIKEIAHKVKVRRAEHNYRDAKMVILDAKFGSKTVKSGDEITSWEEKLADAGIRNIVLSHSNPGDVAIGHKAVKAYLEPHYSATRNGMFPGMVFFKEGCKGDRGPTQDMFNYSWKEGTDKPEEQYKDFPDCVRYAALEMPLYQPPQPEIDVELARAILQKENQSAQTNPLYHGLVMRR